MDKKNTFLLLNSIFCGLITTFYIIAASSPRSAFQNVYNEPLFIGIILLSFPFIALIISFVSFFLFAKYYINKYITGFATNLVESYKDDITNPIENNL